MKYIKSFNEELKSTTYRSAAWKIDQLSKNKSDKSKLIYKKRADILKTKYIEVKKKRIESNGKN